MCQIKRQVYVMFARDDKGICSFSYIYQPHIFIKSKLMTENYLRTGNHGVFDVNVNRLFPNIPVRKGIEIMSSPSSPGQRDKRIHEI